MVIESTAAPVLAPVEVAVVAALSLALRVFAYADQLTVRLKADGRCYHRDHK